MTSRSSLHRALVLALAIIASATAPAFAQRASLPPGSTTNAAHKLANDAISTTDMNILTPVQLAQSLLGTGVTITNVVYSGAPVAAGTFTGGSTPVGFEFGIILGSGDIASVPGPNTSDWISTDTLTPGDPVLTGLSGHPTFNATSLDFDFDVAGAAQVTFQYVFSSDEYNEYVDTQYNDIFAFFLNGVNIALLPNGLPVSVNNVNCGNPHAPPLGANCPLYINNDCDDLPGGTFPCAGAVDTEMDGLTVVLTAIGNLQPGTNHIRLIVADAGDPVYDSNVFIRAQSFTGGPPAPFFDPPTPCGHVEHATVGVPFGYTVVAKAASGLPANAVTLVSSPLPAGAAHVPGLPLGASGPNAAATTTFTWTPGTADLGPHVIDYTATDQLGRTAFCHVTILVENPVVTSGQDYLIIGSAPLAAVIPGSNGRLLLNTADWIVLPVTPDTVPVWLIPPQVYGYRLYAQFGNYDPASFPGDPILMSNGLDIRIGIDWVSYGPANMGIVAWLEEPPLIFEETSFEYEVQR